MGGCLSELLVSLMALQFMLVDSNPLLALFIKNPNQNRCFIWVGFNIIFNTLHKSYRIR